MKVVQKVTYKKYCKMSIYENRSLESINYGLLIVPRTLHHHQVNKKVNFKAS